MDDVAWEGSRPSTGRARAAVGGRTGIVSGGAVLHPLPDIAVHVVKAKSIGHEAAHRHGACQTGISAGIA